MIALSLQPLADYKYKKTSKNRLHKLISRSEKLWNWSITDIFQTLIFSALFSILGILVHDITPWLENPEVTAPVWHFRDVIGRNGLHQWIPRAEKIRNWSNWYCSKIKFFGWYFGLRSIDSFLIMITWFFRQFSAWTPMFVIRCSNNENVEGGKSPTLNLNSIDEWLILRLAMQKKVK